MRYAIVSDIHANLAAWQSVLNDLSDLGAERILCLGDVCGYGPDPVEVLESVYRSVHATLLGNHDAAVGGRLDPSSFSPRAQAAVQRHRERLSETGLAWLRSLPLELCMGGFRCAHGDFSEPERFRYIIAPEDALPSWQATREQVLFVGHSHLPAIYVIGASGKPHLVEPCDFQLEEGKRYIINPGSVGYPRVGDCRSSYCLYDDVTREIRFRQLPFDDAGYAESLRRAGMGADLWLEGRASARRVPSLRERLSFAKPAAAAAHAQDVAERLHRPAPVRRGRGALLAAGAACAALAAAAGLWWLVGRGPSEAAPAVTVPPYELPALNAYPLVPGKNLLPALPRELGRDGRLEGWRYAVEDRARQSFDTGLRDGAITLRACNREALRTRLESPLVNLAGVRPQALRLGGRLRKAEGFSGTVFFQLVTYTTGADGELAPLATQSFEVRGAAGGPAAALSRKIELSRRVTHVRFRVEADFEGVLELEQPSLTDEGGGAAAGKRGRT